MADSTLSLIDKLSNDISAQVGTKSDPQLDEIQNGFDKALNDALKSFNSSAFDDDGFIKKFRDIDMPDADKSVVKNVLNNIKSDYISADTLNQSEMLLKRDIYNICSQMPEMHDVIYTTRDAIIECNVSTGEVSRSLIFANHENDTNLENIVKEIENRHELLLMIKNHIVPKGLMHGELDVQVTPYAKLFAELEALSDQKMVTNRITFGERFEESVPNVLKKNFVEKKSLYNEENVQLLLESVTHTSKVDSVDTKKIESDSNKYLKENEVAKEGVSEILKSIDIYNGNSIMMSEFGYEGMQELLMTEYRNNAFCKDKMDEQNFMEYQMQNFNGVGTSAYAMVDQDGIEIKSYKDIKGAYVKYLNGLRIVPIRMDRRVIGYYYVSTTMDLQLNSANPNGIVDMSFQNYTRDRTMVEQLANMIIKSFDKSFLNKNIQLKNEIVDVIMAHKFSEGKLSFIYIPENEVIHIVLNEDENGKGHSMLEPTMFPARMYLMLTLYNMLYILNNNTTRVHYLKSSGLNKDYASHIQRTMRKFQQRRITIDDIYSYSGVLNKIGGMGEMILPAGRNDFKAIETDTIAAADNPFNLEFLEQQRRQAISGTGAPNLLVINALDDVDFAKTLELANARFQSAVSSYKIDFNRGITKLYQRLMKYETDLDDDIINSFKFQFNQIKQQDLSITSDMIQNFNNLAELAESIYFKKEQLEDDKGNPTEIRTKFRKELARKYLSQMELDELDDIATKIKINAGLSVLEQKAKDAQLNNSDISSNKNS